MAVRAGDRVDEKANKANKANKAKLHHYVPVSYLARFTAADGFLNVFDRKKRAFRRQRPSEVMKINSYYRQNWAPKGIDPNIMEARLGESLETHAKDAIDRLIADPGALTDDDCAILLTYMEMQRIRVPRQAALAKSMMHALIMQMVSGDVREALTSGQFRLTIKDSARFDYMKNAIGTASPWFEKMDWHVYSAAPETSFITTDSPVSFCNPVILPPAEAGLGMVGTRVFFPLSSRFALIMEHPEFEYDASDHRSCTRLLPTPEHEDGHLHIIHGGVMDGELVDDLNWKIAMLSSQLLVGESGAVLDRCIGRGAI
jgi:hypothetical protein